MSWQPLKELPDLRRVGRLSLDIETKDGGLAADRGSGWPWHDGYVCGVSLAYRVEGAIRAHYFSLRHPDSDNFDCEQFFRWLKELIASGVHIITENGLYDWGWLRADGGITMPTAEYLEEIDALATMVDENRYRYSLDALCKWRGLPGKDETLLLEGCRALDLLPKRRRKFRPQGYIWQLPAHYVGPYAETDAAQTLELFESLEPVLDEERTREAYKLEIALLPMVHEMRRREIRIDTAAAERAREQLLHKRDAALAEISQQLGVNVGMAELNCNEWRAEVFDQQGIPYPLTKKGNPSFTAGNSGWMPKHPHWLPRLITAADKYNNAAVNVLENYILGHAVNGRVYAEIHPHRSDDGGARSLRFSYSDPPLQLMPSRDEELAPLIRGVFLPEEGEVWAKPDQAQQEFRFIVHYAAVWKLAKATAMVERYRADPKTDIHKVVQTMIDRDRETAKACNYAKIFGAGMRKFAEMIGKSEGEASAIITRYDSELPFVSQLSQLIEHTAQSRGYVTLYDGARRHFNQWAPGGRWEKGAGPCSREEAEARVEDPEHPWYGQPLYRADTRTAMNALIQGSAARHTKRWMRACWREGIIPLLQMHDSLDCSVSSAEQGELVAQLGRDAVKLLVPMEVELKFGRTWADAKHTWEELHGAPEKSTVSITPPGTEATATVASVPFMITQAMKAQLRAADFTDDEITHMTPQEAHEILNAANLDQARTQWLEQQPSNEKPQPTANPPQLELGLDKPPPTPESPVPKSPAPATKPPSTAGVNGAHVLRSPKSDIVFVSLRDIVSDLRADNKVLCPFHDDHTPSCHIYHDHFYCFVCGASGDPITWLMETEGLTYAEAEVALETFEPRLHPPEDDQRTLRLALALYNKAQPIAGTLAEHNLTGRHIDIAQLPADVPLRFHPHCPFGRGEQPCLLALFRDVATDAPAGILRTALTADGRRIARKALGRWPAPRAIKLWAADETLVVGEGLETVLAAATRLTHDEAPLRPAWALGDAGRLATLPPIPGVKRLIALADNDEPGRMAARACAQTAADAGCTTLLLTPTGVNDFNDVVRRRAS